LRKTENKPMYETLADLYLAVIMVGAAMALIFWFLRSQAAASAGRMMMMMKSIGLGRWAATHKVLGSRALLADVRQRCAKCPREDLCERWLAGKVEGDNGFCPNGPIFSGLK
jgi:hypothetical protein